tara:strand:- start:243 stop:1049 length:807 start_codon:yes stop_codon:yes gene_type:complete
LLLLKKLKKPKEGEKNKMAWNNTVTCSECYQTGHNKSGCPRRKERYEAALAKPEEERGYGERRLIELMEYKKERNSSRRCSYCSEQGHNRRSCTQLKAHFSVIAKMNQAYRTKFVEWIQEKGLNVGALLMTCSDHQARKALCFVQELSWDHINVWQGEIPRFIIAKSTGTLDDRYRSHYTIADNPNWPTGQKWKHSESYSARSYGTEVVGPAEEPVTPPDGWVEDTQPVKEFFKSRRLYDWTEDPSHYNSHDWWKLDTEEDQELKESA